MLLSTQEPFRASLLTLAFQDTNLANEHSMIILDLDNTIANDVWRIPKINWQHADPLARYHDYHSLSAFDAPGNEDLFKERDDIIIFTARPVHYHAITEEWLNRNGVNFQVLLMRNNDDHSHSKDLKLRQLAWLQNDYGINKSDIFCAYDDRQDVVDAYLAAGIHAEVRSIHNVCAYTRPSK